MMSRRKLTMVQQLVAWAMNEGPETIDMAVETLVAIRAAKYPVLAKAPRKPRRTRVSTASKANGADDAAEA
jgi:hypothetical protein